MSGDAAAFLRAIKQPRWALPLPAWVAIGLVYYVACFVVLDRLLTFGLQYPMATAAFVALVATMAANAAWNWVFFKQRDFRGAFYYYFPYAALIVTLIVLLAQVDPVSAALFGVYACYLPYALLWSCRVWKLN